MVIKDIATNGVDAGQAKTLMKRTRELLAEEDGRITIIAAQLHNALDASLMSINAITSEGTASHPSSPDATPGRNARNGPYTLCHQPWVNLTVDFAGRVVGCCRDLRSEYIVGNLLTESAAEIWNGERMRFLRRALAAKQPQDINICGACDMPWRGSCSGRTPVERIRNFFFSDAWER